jgi:hypothetical protein
MSYNRFSLSSTITGCLIELEFALINAVIKLHAIIRKQSQLMLFEMVYRPHNFGAAKFLLVNSSS